MKANSPRRTYGDPIDSENPVRVDTDFYLLKNHRLGLR